MAACGQSSAPAETTPAASKEETEAVPAQTEAESVKDGVYTNSSKGNNGDVTVEVEVKDGKVVRVDVLEHEETPGICDKPMEDIPKAIVDNQSLGIDAVSGATNTSNAILAATELCLKEAGLDVNEWKSREVKKELAQNSDVSCDTVVVGAGGAGMKVAIELDRGGQNVILVEKQSMVGGATSLAATYFVAVDTTFHSENGVNSSLSAARAEGGIIVNQQGLRFCNDYYPDYTVLSKWMMEQEGDFVYILIDQTAMDKSKRLQGFKEKGYFIEADTIEELAQKMGVSEENL